MLDINWTRKLLPLFVEQESDGCSIEGKEDIVLATSSKQSSAIATKAPRGTMAMLTQAQCHDPRNRLKRKKTVPTKGGCVFLPPDFGFQATFIGWLL
jgi:hypothetical protein